MRGDGSFLRVEASVVGDGDGGLGVVFREAGTGVTGYEALAESSLDGMVLAEGGDITFANPAARRLLDREDLALLALEDLFDPIDVRLEPAWEELRRTGRFDGQLLVRRADGTCFTAEVRLRASGGDGVSMVFRSPGERERLGGLERVWWLTRTARS